MDTRLPKQKLLEVLSIEEPTKVFHAKELFHH